VIEIEQLDPSISAASAPDAKQIILQRMREVERDSL